MKDYLLCLDNVLKDFTINNMKKIRIKSSCKVFFYVEFNPSDTSNILDIHK